MASEVPAHDVVNPGALAAGILDDSAFELLELHAAVEHLHLLDGKQHCSRAADLGHEAILLTESIFRIGRPGHHNLHVIETTYKDRVEVSSVDAVLDVETGDWFDLSELPSKHKPRLAFVGSNLMLEEGRDHAALRLEHFNSIAPAGPLWAIATLRKYLFRPSLTLREQAEDMARTKTRQRIFGVMPEAA